MMLTLFRALVDRLKALLAAAAAGELEADLMLSHAQRKAELLRQAQKYDEESLTAVAQELRESAEGLCAQRPLAGVLPAVDFLISPVPALTPDPAASAMPAALPDPAAGRSAARKGGRNGR